MRSLRAWLATLLSAALAPLAQAEDGVVEINQASAMAGEVTPGDAPGFPVSINAPGSYRLTGNLETNNSKDTLIRVNADDVTVDLDGFALLDPNTCSGDPPSTVLACTSIGTENGLNAGDHARITVLNGNVMGMGWKGVTLGADSRVEGVTASHNRGNGIQVGERSIVVGSIAGRNGRNGIEAGRDSVVSGNTAGHNGLDGIIIAGGGVAIENNSSSNTLSGIYFSAGSGDPSWAGSGTVSGNVTNGNNQPGIVIVRGTVIGNASRRNKVVGILVQAQGTIVGNTASANAIAGISVGGSAALVADNTASGNLTGIICVDGSCTVVRNVASNNGDFGLNIGAASGFASNLLHNNNGGNANAQMQGGITIGGNLCGGDTVCP